MSKTINQENLNSTLRFLEKMGEVQLEQLKVTDPQQAENMEKLGALFTNEEFCQQFLRSANQQEAVQLFADHGFDLTVDQIDRLVLQLNGLMKKLMENDGVLSEEDLEQIAGGANTAAGIVGGLSGVPVGFMAGATAGSVICPGIGTLIGAIIGGVLGGLGVGLGCGLGMDEDDF